MKNRLFVVSLFMLIVSMVNAQEVTKTQLQFTGFSFGVGPFSFSSNISSIETFKTLAPNSTFLKADLSGYTDSHYYSQSQSNTIVGGYGHFNVVGKKSSNRLFKQSFRIGISYAEQSVYYDSYRKSETFTIDTLTSNSTGIEYPIDSTSNRNLVMFYDQTQLFVDAAYLLQTKEKNRCSLFGGLGAMVGFTVDATTTILLNEDFTYSANSPRQLSPEWEDFIFQGEVTKNKSGAAFVGYIPIGVDFRMGNTRTFFKNSHLSAEIRPSIYINQIPELETEVTTAVIGMFSYRYQFR